MPKSKASKQEERLLSSFRIPATVQKHSDEARAYLARSGLSKPEVDFITALLDLAGEIDPKSEVTFDYLDFQKYLKAHNLPSHRMTIFRKTNFLLKDGLFDCIEMEAIAGGRPPRLYVLKQIHKPEFQTKMESEIQTQMAGRKNERTKTTKALIKHLRKSDAQFLKAFADAKPVTETIFTGICDRAMRFHIREEVEGQRITTSLRVRNTKIIVQATTQTGIASELAALPDQRVIRAVITEVAHIIEEKVQDLLEKAAGNIQGWLFQEDSTPMTYDEEGQPILPARDESISESDIIEQVPNNFFIDTASLGKRMAYASPYSTSTRETINAALRRLNETNFRVVITNPHTEEARQLMEMFGLEDTSADFRFLTSMKSQFDKSFYDDENFDGTGHQHNMEIDLAQEYLDEENLADPYRVEELRRVRLWRISLDPHLFSRLLDKETRSLYAAHADIMKESSGLGQTLYNLITQVLGRTRHAKEKVYMQPLHVLHNTLWPTRKYFRFEEEIIRLMRRHSKHGWDHTLTINTVSMFGYKFTLMKKKGTKELVLRAERDRNDPLTGDNSYHNQRLQFENTEV